FNGLEITSTKGLELLTNIKYFCIRGCTNTEFIIPEIWGNKLTSMHSSFYGCTNLESIILPKNMDNVTSLSSTFSGCTSLTSIVLPTKIPSLVNASDMIDNREITYTYHEDLELNDIADITIHPTLAVKDYSKLVNLRPFLNSPLIDSTLLTHLILSVNVNINDLFDSNKFNSLVELSDIPPGINDFYGLNYCRNLTRISFENNAHYRVIDLKDLKYLINFKDTFKGCINLENVVLPSNIERASSFENIIQGCSNLKSITISDFYSIKKRRELYKYIDKTGIEIIITDLVSSAFDIGDVYDLKNSDLVLHGSYDGRDISFYMGKSLSSAVEDILVLEDNLITLADIEAVNELMLVEQIQTPESLFLFKGLTKMTFSNSETVKLDLRFAKNISEILIEDSDKLEEILLPIHNNSNQNISITISGNSNIKEVFANKKLNLAYTEFNKII
ncbi:MAG: leucine-rich repeat protein, partial [Paraclostridium sp.]